MEVIQEYSENLAYLNALLACNRFEFALTIPDVSETEVMARKLQESPDEILKEPLGRFFFRYHLISVNNLEHQLFLNDVDEYSKIPAQQTEYRRKVARKVFNKYLADGCRLPVCVPTTTVRSTYATFQRYGGTIGLFDAARAASLYHMKLSAFPSFVESGYYKRLLAFRQYETRPVSTDDFDFLRVLGEGGFGKVYAVSKKDTRAVYACKTMSKQRILERQREQLIINERKILELISHPAIVCMRYAFQDDHALHLMLDLMSGGELQFHLNRFGKFDLHTVRFYAAGLVLGLEFLHSKGIIYRDLKPENIMLDSDGYVRITDLGLCAFIKDGERLHKHCGTRSYMAPEQCHGNQGYGKAADWWSLGVTVYQLLTGKNPFSHRRRPPAPAPANPQQQQQQQLAAAQHAAAGGVRPPRDHHHRSERERAAAAAHAAAAHAAAAAVHGGGATAPGLLPGMAGGGPAAGVDANGMAMYMDPAAAAHAAALAAAHHHAQAQGLPYVVPPNQSGRRGDRERERAEREQLRAMERERRHAAAAAAAAAMAAQQPPQQGGSGGQQPQVPGAGVPMLVPLGAAGSSNTNGSGALPQTSSRRQQERAALIAATLISAATKDVYGDRPVAAGGAAAVPGGSSAVGGGSGGGGGGARLSGSAPGGGMRPNSGSSRARAERAPHKLMPLPNGNGTGNGTSNGNGNGTGYNNNNGSPNGTTQTVAASGTAAVVASSSAIGGSVDPHAQVNANAARQQQQQQQQLHAHNELKTATPQPGAHNAIVPVIVPTDATPAHPRAAGLGEHKSSASNSIPDAAAAAAALLLQPVLVVSQHTVSPGETPGNHPLPDPPAGTGSTGTPVLQPGSSALAAAANAAAAAAASVSTAPPPAGSTALTAAAAAAHGAPMSSLVVVTDRSVTAFGSPAPNDPNAAVAQVVVATATTPGGAGAGAGGALLLASPLPASPMQSHSPAAAPGVVVPTTPGGSIQALASPAATVAPTTPVGAGAGAGASTQLTTPGASPMPAGVLTVLQDMKSRSPAPGGANNGNANGNGTAAAAPATATGLAPPANAYLLNSAAGIGAASSSSSPGATAPVEAPAVALASGANTNANNGGSGALTPPAAQNLHLTMLPATSGTLIPTFAAGTGTGTGTGIGMGGVHASPNPSPNHATAPAPYAPGAQRLSLQLPGGAIGGGGGGGGGVTTSMSPTPSPQPIHSSKREREREKERERELQLQHQQRLSGILSPDKLVGGLAFDRIAAGSGGVGGGGGGTATPSGLDTPSSVHGWRLPHLSSHAVAAAAAAHAAGNAAAASPSLAAGGFSMLGGASLMVPDTPGAGIGRPTMGSLFPPASSGTAGARDGNLASPSSVARGGGGGGRDAAGDGVSSVTDPKLRVTVKYERERAVSHTPTKFDVSTTSVRPIKRGMGGGSGDTNTTGAGTTKFRYSSHAAARAAAAAAAAAAAVSGGTPGGGATSPSSLAHGTSPVPRLGADGKYLDRKELEMMKLQQHMAGGQPGGSSAAGGMTGNGNGNAGGAGLQIHMRGPAGMVTAHHHRELASIFNTLPAGDPGQAPLLPMMPLPSKPQGPLRLGANGQVVGSSGAHPHAHHHHHHHHHLQAGAAPGVVISPGATVPGSHHGLPPGVVGAGGNLGPGVLHDGLRGGVPGAAAGAHGALGHGSKSQLAQTKRYNELVAAYKDILRTMHWPEDGAARSFVRELLIIDDSKRLGAGGAAQLRAHPFFAGFDWDKLLNRHMTPPFVPDSNFVHADFIEAAVMPPAHNNGKQNGGGAGGPNGPKGGAAAVGPGGGPGANGVTPGGPGAGGTLAANKGKFKGFEYVRPYTFQEEVLNVIHNKQQLIDGTAGNGKRK